MSQHDACGTVEIEVRARPTSPAKVPYKYVGLLMETGMFEFLSVFVGFLFFAECACYQPEEKSKGKNERTKRKTG